MSIHTLYILSSGRSGSTLLNLVLGSHSRAIAVGEITHLPKNIALNTMCTCGQVVRQCGFWHRVIELLNRELGIEVWQDPYALELGFISASRVIDLEKLTDTYKAAWKLRNAAVYFSMRHGLPMPAWMRRRFDLGITNTLHLYDAVRAASGAELVVDASKSHLKGINLYLRDPEHTRLILLSRDGRGVFNSRLRNNFTAEESLSAWHNYYQHTLPMLRRLVPESHVLRLRYEELTNHPEREIRRICEFSELDYEPTMLEFGRKTHHVTNGNDMRFNADTRIRPDNAWQGALSKDNLALFEARCGKLNRQLGYQ